jgi:hypothetical protein
VQNFASGEAKFCHHIENKALMKTVISTQQNGAALCSRAANPSV